MSKLLDEATKYLGMNELNNYTELSQLTGVNVRDTPWCAAFVNACLHKVGLRGTGSNLARSFLHLGEDSTEDPHVGDIVVFTRGESSWQGHVAILAKEHVVGDNTVTVLGGNQHDSVCIKEFPVGSILGIRKTL